MTPRTAKPPSSENNEAPKRYCACVPHHALVFLADLRTRMDLRVKVVGEQAWLYWQALDSGKVNPGDLLARVLALPGAEVYHQKGENARAWFRRGQHLPVFTVPDDSQTMSLAAAVVPALVTLPQQEPPRLRPVPLRLVRDSVVRATSAMECSLTELGSWAEYATEHQLSSLQALWERPLGAGGVSDGTLRPQEVVAGRVLLLGRPPVVLSGQRYWGETVLIPLGFRPEPKLNDHGLREVLHLRSEDWALWNEQGFEVVSRSLCQPLTRTTIRLALQKKTP